MNYKRETEYEGELKANVSRIDRTIYFFDFVHQASVAEAFKLIDTIEAENSRKPIQFVVCSRGGDVYEGLALYDRIRFSKCPIHVIGTGFIASMGLIIFLAGDSRAITPSTTLLNHQIAAQAVGRPGEIRVELNEIKRLEKLCVKIISDRTGLTEKKIELDTKKEDYIRADRAIKEGFAHKILEPLKTRTK